MTTVMREKQWADKYPNLGTSPLPTEPYICEEHFARERDLSTRRRGVSRLQETPRFSPCKQGLPGVLTRRCVPPLVRCR